MNLSVQKQKKKRKTSKETNGILMQIFHFPFFPYDGNDSHSYANISTDQMQA